jgi:hypothetical protein
MECYSASSLKQQSVGRHVTPLGHIILIPTQPVFAPTPEWCVNCEEETKTYLIVFGLIWLVLESKIYCTRGKHANHYTTDTLLTSFMWFQTVDLTIHVTYFKYCAYDIFIYKINITTYEYSKVKSNIYIYIMIVY